MTLPVQSPMAAVQPPACTSLDPGPSGSALVGASNDRQELDLAPPPPYSLVSRDGETEASGWEDDQSTIADSARAPDLEVTDTRLLDIAASFFPPVPPNATLPVLPKPVLIPRVSPGPQVPFARAWPPELANHSIVLEDFITFIDNFNIITVPHPVLTTMEIAGTAVAAVPYDIAEGVGGALEGIAILVHIAMAYKTIKAYLAKMNENYFHPRKLHIKVINTKRMMQMLDIDKDDPLVAPLSEATLDLSVQDRCLRHLEDRICALAFDGIPPPSEQSTLLARVAAWQTKSKIADAEKKARHSRKRAWKRHKEGKDFNQGKKERSRVKQLDWLLVENYDQWMARKQEKLARQAEDRRTRIERWATWT